MAEAGSELAGVATPELLLAGWAGFTGLAQRWLLGSASASFRKMNSDASRFMVQLASIKGTVSQQRTAGPQRQASHQADRARVEGVAAQAGPTLANFQSTRQTAEQTATEHAGALTAEQQRGAVAERDAAAAGAAATQQQQAHDSLAAQMQAWAARQHKEARQQAIQATCDRLVAQGYTIRSVSE